VGFVYGGAKSFKPAPSMDLFSSPMIPRSSFFLWFISLLQICYGTQGFGSGLGWIRVFTGCL
jgi:hypothetical protein